MTVPSWRPDVDGAADLVEEVVRIAGLDQRAGDAAAAPGRRRARRADAERQKRARRCRAARSPRAGSPRRSPGPSSRTARPSAFGGGADARCARQSDLGRHVVDAPEPAARPARGRAAQRAIAASTTSACSRSARVYRGETPATSTSRPPAVRAGTAKLGGSGRHGTSAAKAVDLFDAKADVLAVLEALRLRSRQGADRARRTGLVPSRPLRRAAARPQDRARAFRRAASRDARRRSTSRRPSRRSRCSSTRCRRRRPRAAPSRASRRPTCLPVRRDFAFVLDRNVPAGDVVRAAVGADKALIAACRCSTCSRAARSPRKARSRSPSR